MINTPDIAPYNAPHGQDVTLAVHNGQYRECWTIAKQLALRLVPLPLLALVDPALPVVLCLWLATAIYGGLIAVGRSGTCIKLLEIGAAVTLGSLALVTLGP